MRHLMTIYCQQSMIKVRQLKEKKLLNYTHHYEFEQSGLNINDLKKKISEKKIIYDHGVDQRKPKWDSQKTLTKISLENMPTYLKENYKKYTNWLE